VRKFEDILHDKLYEATNDNFSDAIWTNIKGQIPVKKKSKSHFLWLASFLFVFAFMITSIHQYPNWKMEKEETKTAELEKQVRYSGVDFETIPYHEQVTLESNTQELEATTTAETIIALLDKTTEKISLLPRQENKENINLGIAQQNAIPFSFKGELVNREASTLNPPTKSTNSASFNEPIAFSTSITSSVSPIQSGSLFSKLTLDTKPADLNIFKIGRKSKGKDVHCEVLQGKQSKFYISARHISSYAFNNLTSKSSAADEYMTGRHSTESKRYSFSDEVNFGIEYRQGLFAEIGIRYDQINEKFNFLDPNAYQSSTIITTDTLFVFNWISVSA